MRDSRVLALCAQIAIELDRDRADRLIEELTRILVSEYMSVRTVAAEKAPESNLPSKPKPN